MGRIYVLYYDFKHTSGNHAGMGYLSREIQAAISDVRLIRHVRQGYTGGRYVGWVYAVFIALYLCIVLRPGDKVCFMEYLSGHFARQDVIASILRKWRKSNFLLGIIHLPFPFLKDLYNTEERISKKVAMLDHIVVFGNQLKRDIEQLSTVRVTFAHHYAERAYYRPAHNLSEEGRRKLQVLCIGGIKRNWELLSDIVSQCAHVDFHLCIGSASDCFVPRLANVHLYTRLKESELLNLMQQCDVNLSIFEDTVGSNSITSSMAVGLVQVVSRVGSIHDYCSVHDSFLCNSLDDYVRALKALSDAPDLLKKMKQATLEASQRFDKEKFIRLFKSIIGVART